MNEITFTREGTLKFCKGKEERTVDFALPQVIKCENCAENHFYHAKIEFEDGKTKHQDLFVCLKVGLTNPDVMLCSHYSPKRDL